MLDLTLDTSTDPYFAILSEDKKIISSQLFPHQNNLSSALLPTIESLLKLSSYNIKDLSNIFIGVGPGSYTGVRVAVAIATSLSLALNIPLYPFCSLLAFLPKDLPEGPFTFLAFSNHSSAFLLHSLIDPTGIPSLITHEILKEDTLPAKLPHIPNLITLHPEDALKKWDIQTLQGSLNLPLLLNYLSDLKKSPPLPPNIYYLHEF